MRPKFCPKSSEMSEAPTPVSVRNVRNPFRDSDIRTNRTAGISDGHIENLMTIDRRA